MSGTCVCIVYFPAKRHSRGCRGTLWTELRPCPSLCSPLLLQCHHLPLTSHAEQGLSLGILPLTSLFAAGSPEPAPLSPDTPQTRGRGDLCAPSTVPQVARAGSLPTRGRWSGTMLPTASRRVMLLRPHLPPLAGEQLAPSITPGEIGAEVPFACWPRGDMCSFVCVSPN